MISAFLKILILYFIDTITASILLVSLSLNNSFFLWPILILTIVLPIASIEKIFKMKNKYHSLNITESLAKESLEFCKKRIKSLFYLRYLVKINQKIFLLLTIFFFAQYTWLCTHLFTIKALSLNSFMFIILTFFSLSIGIRLRIHLYKIDTQDIL